MYSATGLVLLCTLYPGVRAAPLAKRNSGATTSIVVPVVVVGIFAVVALIVTFTSTSFRSRIATWFTGAAVASGRAVAVGAGVGATELTADQLAGPPQPGEQAPARRSNRRARRDRNSVRSTRSLPMYMKEAGTDEVVVFRGPEDLEDTNIRATIILPAVNERSSPGTSLDLSHTLSRSSQYVPLRDIIGTQNTPLLEEQESPDPTEEAQPRESVDIVHPDERGPTPAYFEVMDMDSQANLEQSTGVDSPEVSQDVVAETSEPDQPSHIRSTSNAIAGGLTGMFTREPSTGGRPASRRQSSGSRLTGLIHRLTGATHPPPMPLRTSRDPTHARGQSEASQASQASSHGPAAARRMTHRPSHSGSGSMLSVFRTTSRPRSQLDALQSPSTISLHSISAPLTHTALRTQFTYPQSGPTAEQMKLIASRESLSRFGMPYGPDALAYSQSMLDLSMPPPVFEAIAGQEGGSEEGDDSLEGLPLADSTAEVDAALPAEDVAPEQPSNSAEDHGDPAVDAPSQQNDHEAPVEPSSVPLKFDEAPSQGDTASPPLAEPVLPPLVESTSSPVPTEPASATSATFPPSVKNPAKPVLPPTSFKPGQTNSRSVSRASSRADSFATATESFYTASQPTTPTLSSPYLVLDSSGDNTLLADAAANADGPATPLAASPSRLHDDSDEDSAHISRRDTIMPSAPVAH